MEEKKIIDAIKSSNKTGRTITEISEISHIPKQDIKELLEIMETKNKIESRTMGMTKLYSIKNNSLK